GPNSRQLLSEGAKTYDPGADKDRLDLVASASGLVRFKAEMGADAHEYIRSRIQGGTGASDRGPRLRCRDPSDARLRGREVTRPGPQELGCRSAITGPLPQAGHGPLPSRADAPTDTGWHRQCAAVCLEETWRPDACSLSVRRAPQCLLPGGHLRAEHLLPAGCLRPPGASARFRGNRMSIILAWVQGFVATPLEMGEVAMRGRNQPP